MKDLIYDRERATSGKNHSFRSRSSEIQPCLGINSTEQCADRATFIAIPAPGAENGVRRLTPSTIISTLPLSANRVSHSRSAGSTQPSWTRALMTSVCRSRVTVLDCQIRPDSRKSLQRHRQLAVRRREVGAIVIIELRPVDSK